MNNILKFLRHDYFRFSIAAIIYLLWVIWLGNYWFLVGLAVVYDVYITKKVNWSPWKKRGVKNHWLIEWLDALIFAVIAVTIINIFLFQNYRIPTGSMEKSLLINDHLYVSKVAYGPRTPNTPIGMPFTQNIMFKKLQSYTKWPMLKSKRLKGFGKVKRNDIVVFNFPEGDTVPLTYRSSSYYLEIRRVARQLNASGDPDDDERYFDQARKYLLENDKVFIHPIDRRDNYVKRCVAIAGDTLEMNDGVVYINGEMSDGYTDMQYKYTFGIKRNAQRLGKRKLSKLGIYRDDIASIDSKGQALLSYYQSDSMRANAQYFYTIPLTEKNNKEVSGLSNVLFSHKQLYPKGYYDYMVFPHDSRYKWNEDNFGPLYIPKKGATIHIDTSNISLYDRVIDVYEDNDLEIINGEIIINGEKATEYTFKMDYYFMVGDNRHSSLDSRIWGFVPEDHIIGKPKFIWLSLDKDKKFPANIRFKRMFKSVDKL